MCNSPITSAYEIEDGLRNYHRTTVSIDYSKSIIESGGIPIVLPVTSNLEVIKKQLELLDGIIFAGGVDINPSYYGQDFKIPVELNPISIATDKMNSLFVNILLIVNSLNSLE
ncbi:gamma-glutamyl-gamma-aminobutyrate hydrolase family protein [Fusobacterium mortiferum]|nr:gamma-glutamyl-gamma-aminobutyrate hydrolase family protein [Fusobacterium mortiferum]